MKKAENKMQYYDGQKVLLAYYDAVYYARIEKRLKPRTSGYKEENWMWVVVIVPDTTEMPRFPIPIKECEMLGYKIITANYKNMIGK